MKFVFLLLFSGSLVTIQAQNTINLTGSWCEVVMQLSVDLDPNASVMTWTLNDQALEGENGPTIDCLKYGSGIYKVEIAQDYDIVYNTFEVSNDEVPEINFSVVSYPAAAVTICDNITIEGEEIASLNWDFGNGETSTESKPQIFYKSAQEYTITLTVTTVSGCTYTVSKKHNWTIN